MRQLGLRQPIIMLTAQHDEVDKVHGLEMGADDYMTKPFSLRRAYGDYSSAESSQLLIQDVVLDSATGQARRGEESLNLTPAEFRLLSYLARHRGQALSRAQIVEAVWGFAPGNLDSCRTGIEIMHLLREFHEEGRTIIMVTHDLSVARHASRVYHMRDGVLNESELPDVAA